MSLEEDKIKKIKKLRLEFGVSIDMCKKTLEVNNWDVDKSIQDLKENIQNTNIDAKLERVTKNGIIAIKIIDDMVFFICLMCETDFVARNEIFQNIALKCIDLFIDNIDTSNLIKENIVSLGENIKIEIIDKMKANCVYLHGGTKMNIGNKLGLALIDNSQDAMFKKRIAQHIVCLEPKSVDEMMDQDWFLDNKKKVKDLINKIESIKYIQI